VGWNKKSAFRTLHDAEAQPQDRSDNGAIAHVKIYRTAKSSPE
jgi:hypothetical protein